MEVNPICDKCPWEDTDMCKDCTKKNGNGPKLKPATYTARCDRCKAPLRVKTTLVLDMPAAFASNLTKAKLRMKEIQLEAVTKDTYYCPNCGFRSEIRR